MLASISRRVRENQSGFTLIELLVVVAIIALLATFAVPRLFEAINKSKAAPGMADLNTVSSALERHYMDDHAYPDDLDDLTGEYVRATTTFVNGFSKGYVYLTNGSYYVLVDPGNHSGSLTITCGTLTRTVTVGGEPISVDTGANAPTAACTFTSSVAGFDASLIRHVTN